MICSFDWIDNFRFVLLLLQSETEKSWENEKKLKQLGRKSPDFFIGTTFLIISTRVFEKNWNFQDLVFEIYQKYRKLSTFNCDLSWEKILRNSTLRLAFVKKTFLRKKNTNAYKSFFASQMTQYGVIEPVEYWSIQTKQKRKKNSLKPIF